MAHTPDSSSNNFVDYTPSDSPMPAESRYILIGSTAGNLVVKNKDGTTVTIPVAANQCVPVRTRYVMAATTAAEIFVFYGNG